MDITDPMERRAKLDKSWHPPLDRWIHEVKFDGEAVFSSRSRVEAARCLYAVRAVGRKLLSEK